MALSNQTKEAIIPPPAPPSINEKEELRQVGFLLRNNGHYLIFRASRSLMVNGWSQHQGSAEYAEAFSHMVRATHFKFHKIAFNRMKPARTDIYVMHVGRVVSPVLEKWFEQRSQEFLYSGTCPTAAMNVAKQLITEIAESVK